MNIKDIEFEADVTARGANIQLAMDEGVSFNKANTLVTAFYKAEGLQAERAGGFRASFYTFLKEGEKTEYEVLSFVADNGSDNDAKKSNKGHWIAIWNLVEEVRS